MNYMISWFERPLGSTMEHEKAQKRILEVFTRWKAPALFHFHAVIETTYAPTGDTRSLHRFRRSRGSGKVQPLIGKTTAAP